MRDNGYQWRKTGLGMPEILTDAGYVPLEYLSRPRRIRTNVILFFATVLTTMLAGALLSNVNPFSHPQLIYKGWPFAVTIMGILLSHELGHYVMSRRHGVDATLPYFIPAPTLVGTFGAIIKIRSSVPDRRALLDIGAAGPIAGFVASVPALVVGLKLSETVAASDTMGATFGTSVLLEFLAAHFFPAVPEGYAIQLHPVAFAGWIGMLVTMLNLLPVGMMDGGHIAYAMFGRWHHYISRVVILVLLVMGIFGWYGWAVWGMLNIVVGLRHPPPTSPDVPLDGKRRLVGVLSATILVLTFIPTPFSIQ